MHFWKRKKLELFTHTAFNTTDSDAKWLVGTFKIKKRTFLTCRLLRQGHPLNLLPANLQYWGLHSQRAVYTVHCRHFSFLQLPFVLPNKTHIWCIVHGTVSLQTTEGRQQAIQLRQCQVESHWVEDEPGPSSYYIQVASGTASPLSTWWSWKVSDQRFCSSPHSTNTTLYIQS